MDCPFPLSVLAQELVVHFLLLILPKMPDSSISLLSLSMPALVSETFIARASLSVCVPNCNVSIGSLPTIGNTFTMSFLGGLLECGCAGTCVF